jgi:hypothetical protein
MEGGGQAALPYPCVKNYRPSTAPIIVPPSFLKPELASPLLQVWSGAAKALREADRIIFVGYSFPQSDTEMTYFFASALATNVRLEELRIVDPNAVQIIERLTTPRSKFGSHFRDLLVCEPKSWTEVALKLPRST